MMVVDMVDLGTDWNLWTLGIVAVQETPEVDWSVLELVLDWISDLLEEFVSLAGPPAGQTSERLDDALLG